MIDTRIVGRFMACTALLLAHALLAFAGWMLDFIPTLLASLIAAAYAIALAIMAIAACSRVRARLHLLPERQRGTWQGLTNGKSTALLAFGMAAFGFIAMERGIAGYYTWVAGSPGNEVFTVERVWLDRSVRRGTCHNHKLREVSDYQAIYRPFCSNTAFPVGSAFHLRGRRSALGFKYQQPIDVEQP